MEHIFSSVSSPINVQASGVTSLFNSCALMTPTEIVPFLRVFRLLHSRLCIKFVSSCSRSPRKQSEAIRSRNVSAERSSLVADQAVQRVQTLLLHSQYIHWSCYCILDPHADRLCQSSIILLEAYIVQRQVCHPEDEVQACLKGVRNFCPASLEQSTKSS